jgi:glycosyltransferase involved in cell wall biosynthesis
MGGESWIVPVNDDIEPLDRPTSFSVVIAAHNAAGFVRRAIDSLLAQTTPPKEIIVSDDGSTDDLAGALSPYGDAVTLIRKDHAGEASAKNAGARAASGDFIAILDADDRYLPRRLEALTALARARPDLDILTTDAYLEVGDDRIRRCYSSTWTFPPERQREEILKRNFIFGHVAVRRDRFLAVGGFDEEILWTTDWDCWIRLLFDGARAGCIAEPLAVYHVHEDSLSAQRANLVAGRVQTLEKTARRNDLTKSERMTLERSLHEHRREFALLALHDALRDQDADVRARAAAVARDASFPPSVRLKAALAAIFPSIAGLRERRRRARSWIGSGGTSVRRP